MERLVFGAILPILQQDGNIAILSTKKNAAKLRSVLVQIVMGTEDAKTRLELEEHANCGRPKPLIHTKILRQLNQAMDLLVIIVEIRPRDQAFGAILSTRNQDGSIVIQSVMII